MARKEKVITIVQSVWLSIISLISPLIVEIIFMNLTGHGKGYGYDLGSEADISFICGVFEVIVWISVFIIPLILLCRKLFRKNKMLTLIPIISVFVLFCTGVLAIGFYNFAELFGYNNGIIIKF